MTDQRFDLVRAVARGASNRPRDQSPPSKPSYLQATHVSSSRVTLTWRGSRDNVKVVAYEVYRNGHRVIRTAKRTWTDPHCQPGTKYSYMVRAFDRAGNHSPHSKIFRVRTPAIGASALVGPTAAPLGVVVPLLTPAMVDRLWWRAGFGPTDDDRAAWIGQPVADLVEHFVSSPQTLDPTVPPPLTETNGPIDPTVTTEELTMEWLWTMQRASNPLIERLTLFLHRHWCITVLTGGIPNATVLTYRDRLRSYADLAANPTSSFKQLALDMTTKDGAMSLFLTGYANVKGHANENYAREFMELFTLGVRDDAGNANYTQLDVTALARAFTGWRLDQNPGPTFGTVTFGGNSYFDKTAKTIFGQTANFGADPSKGSGDVSAIDLVFNHPAHVPFLVRKLWAEFIVTPIPADALASLSAAYYANGQFLLKPLVRGILSHALIFESLDEPNMIKPPVVYLVGLQRPLKAPMKGYWQHQVLENMQQCVYEAPNVAGWEGGVSWLNSNTVQARFDAVRRTIFLTYNTGTNGYPGRSVIADIPAETGAQAFDRAFQLVGSPWLSAASHAQILALATTLPSATSVNRAQRIYTLMALIVGGPDGQVM